MGEGDSKPPFCSPHFRPMYERFTWKDHLSSYHFHNIFSDTSVPLTESLILGHLPNCAFHARRSVIEAPHMATVPVTFPHVGIASSGHLSWDMHDRDLLQPELGTQGLPLCFMCCKNDLCAVKGEVQPHCHCKQKVMTASSVRSVFPETVTANQQGTEKNPAGIMDKIVIPPYSRRIGKEVKTFRKN